MVVLLNDIVINGCSNMQQFSKLTPEATVMARMIVAIQTKTILSKVMRICCHAIAMPSVCCVSPCRSRSGGYTFPSDAKLRKWWIAAVRRDKWHPVAASQVCQRHFVEDKYVAITTLIMLC
uniref:THAP-type domain-containing protein n=1 Tax=Scylla olivacea TaxID=85551 RepID=A0A0P4WL36_SCYOL